MKNLLTLMILSLVVFAGTAAAAGSIAGNAGAGGSLNLLAQSNVSVDQWIDAAVIGGSATITDYTVTNFKVPIASFVVDSNADVNMNVSVGGPGSMISVYAPFEFVLPANGVDNLINTGAGTSIVLKGEHDSPYTIYLEQKDEISDDLSASYRKSLVFTFAFSSTANWH